MRNHIVANVLWAVLLCSGGIVAGCSPAADQGSVEEQAAEEKAFAGVVDLRGRDFDPFALCKTGPVVLTFLATECPIANEYAPLLAGLRTEYEQQGVHFVHVYADPMDSPEKILSHRREYALKATAVRDLQHALVHWTGARVTPEVAVVSMDRRLAYTGRIDDRRSGLGQRKPEPTRCDLREALDAVLAGKSPRLEHTTAVGCLLADVDPLSQERK